MCHDFGEYDVNLNLQNLLEDAESEVAMLRDAATLAYSDLPELPACPIISLTQSRIDSLTLSWLPLCQ